MSSLFDSVHSFCTDAGEGKSGTLLLIHGFGTSSRIWHSVLPVFLAEGYRCIVPDLPGFGQSDIPRGMPFSSYDHAAYLAELLKQKKITEVSILAHGCGCAPAGLLAADPAYDCTVSKLILISGTSAWSLPGKKTHISTVIRGLSMMPFGSKFDSVPRRELVLRMIFKRMLGRARSVPPELTKALAADLSVPGRLSTMIESASAFTPIGPPEYPAGLPVLYIFGAEDSAERTAEVFSKTGQVFYIAGCGHYPQVETPDILAETSLNFLAGSNPPAIRKTPPKKQGALASLFDSWTIQDALTVGFLHILQFLHRLGVSYDFAGWRKVSSIFVCHEYSKFMLGVFRLKFAPEDAQFASKEEMHRAMILKLQKFCIEQPPLQWAVRVHRYAYYRHKLKYFDIVEARLDSSGNLIRIKPYFDPSAQPFMHFTSEQIRFILKQIMNVYNSMKYISSKNRLHDIRYGLRKWVAMNAGTNIKLRRSLNALAERIMSAMFVYCEDMPEGMAVSDAKRFRTPDLRKQRHPGWGMSCIVARFTADRSEVDLWWQINHVTADGAPVQEVLDRLKREWGAVGPVIYPELNTLISTPEVLYCGDNIFRARVYADFSAVSALRKQINAKWSERMNGPASLAGILLWGLSRHQFLADKKVLIPVDCGFRNAERQLGLLMIRPGRFRIEGRSELESFLEFQRSMNLKMADLRAGKCASNEFLQLCTMLHPFFYHAAKYLAAGSLDEIMGTVGFTVIRNSEMFISPLTEFQKNGFLSLGSIAIPTANGRRAGALCICGSRSQIRCYLEALRTFIRNPDAVFTESVK